MAENIHTAMLQVYKAVGYVQKGGYNQNQRYRFAGEADLIAALRPAMVDAGIVFWCSDIRDVRTSEIVKAKRDGSDGLTINVAATFAFTFAHAASGTSINVLARGEGSDSLDKASYKAMTGALKYALRQSFVIETGDDPDDTAEHQPSAAGSSNGRTPDFDSGNAGSTPAPATIDPERAKRLAWVEKAEKHLLTLKDQNAVDDFGIQHEDALARLKAADPELSLRLQNAIAERWQALSPAGVA